MGAANFFGIFVGIESPDPATLVAMRKKQNTRRNIAESIHKIYGAGMLVTAGFIVGFDNEKLSMAEAMIDFIEEAAIPVAMVGLLYALPNTQLTRRLAKEGRLHADHDLASTTGGDQCTSGINFDPVRPLRDILMDYKTVLERVYSPAAYAGRVDKLMTLLDRSQAAPRARRGRHPRAGRRDGNRASCGHRDPRGARTAVADLHELRQARHVFGADRGADDRGLCASRTVLAQGHRCHRRAPRRAG